MGKTVRNQGLKKSDPIEDKLTLLNMAIESAGMGIWVFDLTGNKKYFDDKASRLLGFKPNQGNRTKKEFLDCVHPDDRKEVNKE